MNLVENVTAGILVALFLWTARRVRSRWTSRASRNTPVPSDYVMEQQLMGQSGNLTRPDLPHGAHRDLVDLLHDLHARGGRPSVRTIADLTKLPRSTVHKVMCSKDLGGSSEAAQAIACAHSSRQRHKVTNEEHEEVLDDLAHRVEILWRNAKKEEAGPDPVEAAAMKILSQMSNGAGTHLPERIADPEWDAITKSRLLGASYDPEHSLLTLWFETPDAVTHFDLEDGTWPEEFARTLSLMVGKLVHVAVCALPDFELDSD
ncbi:hypothetical protein J7E99_03310 [Streptomyces sp. ISL-44]|uniref:hypothetical protein n=1 Tax=Streptomyces sp. ISL-44 TaxID=2819184 RepID=UPI001BE7B535|nr:hypothetical protein [Streptomyces sp. ISL-44]MBT2539758.1 hypothetical protein [Streptomyces sp. ISL-44]